MACMAHMADMADMTPYELYRRASLGMALTDSLDELILGERLDPQMAMRILSQFDVSIAEALDRKLKTNGTLKGHLHVYRFCDEVWTFVVENARFKLENETIEADKVKIVASKSKFVSCPDCVNKNPTNPSAPTPNATDPSGI